MDRPRLRDRVLLPDLDQQGLRAARPGSGRRAPCPVGREPSVGRRDCQGQARGPSADRQVDLLHQRRFHPGPLRHPLRWLRPRRRVSGTRAQRDHLEAGSGRLRRAVRSCSRPVQARKQDHGRGIPSGTDRQRHQVKIQCCRGGCFCPPGTSERNTHTIIF